MIYEQLERLLTEQGFSKVPSNLPEFSFFFRNENTYVNVLHIIEYKQGLYITEEQYAHIKETIRGFFRTKKAKDVHILSLLICPDMEKAKQLCGSDPLCWLIDPVWKRLLIYENQAADFYGMKSVLENFLSEMAAHEGNEQETFAGSDGNRYDKKAGCSGSRNGYYIMQCGLPPLFPGIPQCLSEKERYFHGNAYRIGGCSFAAAKISGAVQRTSETKDQL